MSKTRVFRIYCGLIQRCNNPNKREYRYYGAKGIKLVWKSFEEFYRDMGKSYEEHVEKYGETNTTLERIDRNGHYCKENTEWATRKEQSANTSRTIAIEHFGRRRSLRDLCLTYSLCYQKMRDRIKRRGMTFEEAAGVSIDWALKRLRKRLLR